MFRIQLLASIALFYAGAGLAQSAPESSWLEARKTCKQVDSCEEAVIMWCNGYYGADRDNDGIPCENICRSLTQVNAIRQQIGC